MSITCTRRISWCAGHRVLGHEGKCALPHGHQYTAEITASPYGNLDKIGRVVDFSILKQVYQTFVDMEWDHGFLVSCEDTELLNALNMVAGAKVCICQFNPTAENIAEFLVFDDRFVKALAQYKVVVEQVVVHETPNCSACCTRR